MAPFVSFDTANVNGKMGDALASTASRAFTYAHLCAKFFRESLFFGKIAFMAPEMPETALWITVLLSAVDDLHRKETHADALNWIAMDGARKVPYGAAGSNSERAAPPACVGAKRYSAVRLSGIDRLDELFTLYRRFSPGGP